MLVPLISGLLAAAAITTALPGTIQQRTVTSLDQAAFDEAHTRDDTATRAFSSVPIKVP